MVSEEVASIKEEWTTITNQEEVIEEEVVKDSAMDQEENKEKVAIITKMKMDNSLKNKEVTSTVMTIEVESNTEIKPL